jgi:hypothetical protein
VFGDLCSPITLATDDGKWYFLLLVDDHIRFMWLTLLKTKDEVVDSINRFTAEAEVESGHPH